MLGRSDQGAAYGNPDSPLGDTVSTPAYTGPSGGAHAIGAPAAASRRTRRIASAPLKVKGGGALALVGFLTVLFGAWAGLVPYLGPSIGFGATGTPAWRWSLLHTLLWLAPGAVAVVCGMFMLTMIPSLRDGRGGRPAGLAGFLAFLCGAWLAIGPLAWRVLEKGSVFTGGSAWHDFLTRLGYSYGPAVIVAMLGGVAMGLVVGRRLTGLAMTGGLGAFPAGSSTIPTGSTGAIPTASSQPF